MLIYMGQLLTVTKPPSRQDPQPHSIYNVPLLMSASGQHQPSFYKQNMGAYTDCEQPPQPGLRQLNGQY